MIEVKLLNNNNIISLESTGKQIIKSSAGLLFYNSMELLCVSIGSCIGKHLVRYCSHNTINIELFQSITIDIKNNTIIVSIQHPKELNNDTLTDIKNLCINCDIAKMLKSDIIVNMSTNTIDTKIIEKTKPCCGG